MTTAPHPKTSADALRILQEGNERHRAGEQELRSFSPHAERHEQGQAPFAAIIACADSRVSPTLAFDLHRGNLFVSRVAGNSIDTGTLGSTEYAVAVLGVKLIVVLGHSDCGAVNAAIGVANGVETYPAERYGSIGAVIEAIVPNVESLPAAERTPPSCVRANARAQTAELARRGPIIRPAVEAGRIRVVAAVYEIETGGVELL